MKRRFFLGLSLLCPFLKLDTSGRKLVIDYENHDNPNLFRTVVYYDEYNRPFNSHVVKRAWLWPSGNLEVEYYCIIDKKQLKTLTNDGIHNNSLEIATCMICQYTLITYDGYGNVKYKITNIA